MRTIESYLTIADIMERKYFNQSQLIGGEKAKKRNVKWVHVVEITQIDHLLNGNELILTTGIAWKENEPLFLSWLQQLIQANAAGLCIEMGTHISAIPQKGIDLAEKHDFPIILFHQEVPFVAITQDIHSVIINRQYTVLSSIEKYSQELNAMLLEVNDYEQIIKILQNYLDVQVLAIFHQNEVKAYPSMKKEDMDQLLEKVLSANTSHLPSILQQSIQILGEDYAAVVIHSTNRDLTETDSIILDRTVTSLAQYFLRDFYVEEKKATIENQWIRSCLDGEFSDEEIRSHLSYSYPQLDASGATVCICKFPHTHARSKPIDPTYFILLFRTIMEQSGFQVFSTEIHQNLIFLLVDKRSSETWKERMSTAFQRIDNSERNGKKRFVGISYAVGKYVTKIGEVHMSYKTAKEVFVLREKLIDNRVFYQEYHIHRILTLIKDHSDLEEIVYEYLAPLIMHDQKCNGELMMTLKTYLNCNGSKQETAKQLFIVRQTLYHRLERIEKLIGKDYMKPDRRLALEFMVSAYDYLVDMRKKAPISQLRSEN